MHIDINACVLVYFFHSLHSLYWFQFKIPGDLRKQVNYEKQFMAFNALIGANLYYTYVREFMRRTREVKS